MYTERKVGIAIIDKFVDKSVLFIISYPWTECNHRKKRQFYVIVYREASIYKPSYYLKTGFSSILLILYLCNVPCFQIFHYFNT